MEAYRQHGSVLDENWGQKSTYLIEYLSKYWTDLTKIFGVGRNKNGD